MMRVLRVLCTCVAALAFAAALSAQQDPDRRATVPPLVQLLQAKGILTPQEAAEIADAASADEVNARLAKVLVSRGLISQQDYINTVGSAAATDSAAADNSGSPRFLNTLLHAPANRSDAAPLTADPFTYGAPAAEGQVIPAAAPVRVLPIDIPKQGGLIPDLQLGSGAKLKLYGFFKASAIENTASSGSAQNGYEDFPLPLLLGDTGPTGDPYFSIKARSTRIGGQFEWVPANSDLVITARLEADYEGDFTTVNNRSISSARSSQLSIRLGWARLDTHFGDLPVFAEFGQDWTLLGASTMPNIFETTQSMGFFGNIYERIPQFKVGTQFHSGALKVEPDFAITWPISSDPNLSILQREGVGDRAGAESNQPGIEGRLVFDFPLNRHWQGVPSAELIFSAHHSMNNEIVTHGNSLSIPINSTFNLGTLASGVSVGGSTGLPTGSIQGVSNCPAALDTTACSVAQIFPTGLQEQYPQNVWTAEVQLPTPWVTFAGKYYNGNDMRFFFGGQLNTVWENLGGLPEAETPISSVGIVAGAPGVVTTNTAVTATSFSGQQILFGCAGGAVTAGTFSCNGTPIVASSLEPVRGQGGWAEMTFPLPRIFNANPEGRNAGWTFHMVYGTDRTNADDVRHTGANGLARTDYDSANISWKINKWVTFVNEVTYMETRAATHNAKLFRGVDATVAHDWRQEFGTVFVF
jgi:hypothetical protein